MIDLKNLETMVWVARLGGFSLAAQRLNTTQPGISQRIAALEESLGVKLFERKSRGVALTAKGRELLPIAEQMLRLRLEILKVSGSPDLFRGHVRLGVSETIVHTKLIKLVESIRTTYPSISLDIEVNTSRNLRDHLLDGNIDIAFLMGQIVEPSVRNVQYVSFPLAWIASPKLQLPKRTISLQEVAAYPVITYLKDTRPHLAIRELFEKNGTTNFKIYGNASLSAIVRLCTEGIGIGVMPPTVVERELDNESLQVIDVAGGKLPDMNFTISYLYATDAYLLDAIAELALKL
jgi:DNA-binding transcriptional LysR family regulator